MDELNFNDMALRDEETTAGVYCYDDMPDFDEVEIPEFPTPEDIPGEPEEIALTGEEEPEPEETTTEPEEAQESEAEAPKEEKLTAYEQAILDEVTKRAQTDELLASGLANPDKTIKACYAYVTSQAKKRAVAGCAMIADHEVYGWAVHYYIEPNEVIEKEMGPKTTPKKAVTDKAVKKIKANPLLASLMEKKGFKPTEEGAVVKTSHMNNGNTKEVKVNDTAKVTTIKGKGGSLTFTEFSLF